MHIGWISIHRKILDNELIWDDKPFNRGAAFIDLLLLANHEDRKILFDSNLINVKRGQHLTSIRKLSERWGWSKNKVSKFLDVMEMDGMLIKDSNAKRTLLTIVNYDVYQNCEDTEGTLKGHRRDTEGTLKGLNNNINNNNNDNKRKKYIKKESQTYFENEELNKAFIDFIEYRKAIKKPLNTERAVTLSVNKINQLSGGDTDKAIAIIDQSIQRGWQGLFELKDYTPTRREDKQDGVRSLTPEAYYRSLGIDISTITSSMPEVQ